MTTALSNITLQDIVTNVITAFLIVIAVLAHTSGDPGSKDLTFVDAAALLALGRTYGTVSAANGYAKIAVAAHKRLDAINAPPSNDGESV